MIDFLLRSYKDLNKGMLAGVGGPLMAKAARLGHASIVALLLKKKVGADEAHEGQRPLMVAAGKGHLAALRNEKGYAALHAGVSRGSAELVQALLDAGAPL